MPSNAKIDPRISGAPDKCSPSEPGTPRDWQCVVDACRLLEQSVEPVSFTVLANAVDLSPWRFHRVFKEILGITPKHYANALQRQRTQRGLQSSRSVADALYEAGFDSMSQFYARVPGMLGMTPSDFRNGAEGIAIDYAFASSALGELLVAATGEGVCSVQFGESQKQLLDDLTARFVNADIVMADKSFADTVTSIAGLVEKPDTDIAVPLDVQGTAFQEKVWRVLRGIPVGSTMSYKDVAVAMGKPDAHRAVANSCGANEVALLIPCHRVVRSDGSAGGYRWGIERKQKLLATENRQTRPYQ